MIIQYIIGPAGSGKTTLTKAIMDYVKTYNRDLSVITMNLDPAVRTLPYIPDIDIQDYVTLDEVVQKTGLGPNGAMIEATAQMVNFVEEIKYEINQYNNLDLVLIDTPGQMELFSFRDTGPMIANALGFGEAQRGIIFCYDATMCQRPNGLISTLLLAASVQYRFANLPLTNVLTKRDLLSTEKIEMLLDWVENEYALMEAAETLEKGMLRELTISLGQTFQNFGGIMQMIPLSAKYNEGMDNLWGSIQQKHNDDSSPYY